MVSNKIIIAGGTGFIGQTICAHLKNYAFVILCRNKQPDRGHIRYVEWDGRTLGDWTKELEESVAIINLAGRSVDCRHNASNRKQILESRIHTTSAIGQAILQAKTPPKVWINASSAALYDESFTTPNDEFSKENGTGFLAEVAKQWESTFNGFSTSHTRKVILRITTVLGKHGGAFPVFKRLAKLGLAGKQGIGTQYMSWVHEEDLVNIVDWMIRHNELSGVYNCASPNPLTNTQFMKSLRQAYSIPIGLPAPTLAIKLGAGIIGTAPELILSSTNVVPTRLLQSGFQFQHPDLQETISSLQ